MKKFIAAFDGLKFSMNTLKYTIYLAHKTNAHVVGVFLDEFLYHSYTFKDIAANDSENIDTVVKRWNKADHEMRNESVRLFEESCQLEGIGYTVHRDKNIAIQDLLHESIYADLLVINTDENFKNLEEEPPTTFLRDLLEDVQCPVLVVSGEFKPFENVVLLYDGEPVSVYAVKMFSYLLGDLASVRIEVVSIRDDDESIHLPEGSLMKEFMKRHFPEAVYHVFKGSAEEQIVSFLKKKTENSIVVLGAYNRGRVSRWFRQSMADHLMKNVSQPLFIAHNK